jgi:hypothetical protein
MTNRVFLSYAGHDRDWVRAFATTLRDSGVATFFDKSDIEPGEDWQEKIEQALRESNTLVVVLSPDSLKSPWGFFELGVAVADKKRIIPVIAQDVDISQVPLPVRRFQMVREESPIEAGKRVAGVIERGNAPKKD